MKKGARRMKQKQNWMKQSAGLKVVGWVAWLVLGAVVLAFAKEPAAPVAAAEAAPVADESRGLCDIVQQGVALLDESSLALDEDAAQAALLEALILTADPAATFLDESELDARRQQQAERGWDTGLVLAPTDGLPKVAGVRANSPAAATNVLAGEEIVSVAGEEVPRCQDLSCVRAALAAGESAELKLAIRAADGKTREVTLKRVESPPTTLLAIEELPNRIGYMSVGKIQERAGADIAAALESWEISGVFGAILDLRGAGGAAEEEIPAIASLFSPTGKSLYTLSDRGGKVLRAPKPASVPCSSMPLMVLVDEGTRGAAELLAAVLGGSVNGAMLIGRETAGDPLIREPRQLPSGQYALLAARQLKVADGQTYVGLKGVIPDVIISDAALNESLFEPDAPVLRKGKTMTDEEKEDKALRDRTRHDTYLRRATDILLGLKALGYGRNP